MARITLREKMDAIAPSVAGITNIVYIPVVGDKAEIKLYEDKDDFTLTKPEDKKALISYNMAEKLLENGSQVLYETFISIDDMTFEHLKDKGKYPLRFICLGGYVSEDSKTELEAKIIDVATDRGDCIALIDISPKSEDFNYITDVQTKADKCKSEYAAMFTPLCKFDSDDNYYPGSFAYLLAYTESIKSNDSWFAAAGAVRGRVPGLESLSYEYGEKEINDNLYHTKENAISVNPIMEVRPYGYLVWGNRTLAANNIEGIPESNDETYATTAKSFLNVRHICCEIKQQAYAAAKRMTFEPNSDITWINFKALITPLLDRMVSNSGIRGYKVTKLETKAKVKGLLKCKIRIVPIEAVEDFDIVLELADELEVTE